MWAATAAKCPPRISSSAISCVLDSTPPNFCGRCASSETNNNRMSRACPLSSAILCRQEQTREAEHGAQAEPFEPDGEVNEIGEEILPQIPAIILAPLFLLRRQREFLADGQMETIFRIKLVEVRRVAPARARRDIHAGAVGHRQDRRKD